MCRPWRFGAVCEAAMAAIIQQDRQVLPCRGPWVVGGSVAGDGKSQRGAVGLTQSWKARPFLSQTWPSLGSASRRSLRHPHVSASGGAVPTPAGPSPAPRPSAVLRHQLLETVCPRDPFLTTALRSYCQGCNVSLQQLAAPRERGLVTFLCTPAPFLVPSRAALNLFICGVC